MSISVETLAIAKKYAGGGGSIVRIDTTLTKAGYAADAKAAGDLIAELAAEIDASTITVTGTDPVIMANANTRYVCGEVQSISITPPASGICDVTFTSGSTAAVLTVPSTVKFPSWFDATALEANTIYEINIANGLAAVMSWAS